MEGGEHIQRQGTPGRHVRRLGVGVHSREDKAETIDQSNSTRDNALWEGRNLSDAVAESFYLRPTTPRILRMMLPLRPTPPVEAVALK